MKINTVHLFVFIVSLLIIIFAVAFFDIVKTDAYKPQYNFVPFPGVVPDVQGSDIDTLTKCAKYAVPCDPQQGCKMCGEGYECSSVEEGQSVIYKGGKLTPGKWCLPSGLKKQGCNLYTSRSVWSEQDGKQQWECVCLYPDLFGGPTCSDQLACRDGTGPNQEANKLVSQDSRKIVWDPNSKDFNPQGTTPYDTIDGKPRSAPLFMCQCDANKDDPNGLKYVNLPNDPYRCHLDPCTPSHTTKYWDSTKNQCVCPQDAGGKSTYFLSNVTGTCMLPDCGAGNAWDATQNKCACPGQSVSKTCNSPDTNTRPGQPNCDTLTDYQGAKQDRKGGSFCDYPCGTSDKPYCQNNAPATIKDLGGGNYGCSCDCSKINTSTTNFSGDHCEHSCSTNGTIVGGPGSCATQEQQKNQCGCCEAASVNNDGIVACGPKKQKSCFIAGTLISCGDGSLKRIEDICRGDIVLSGKTLCPVRVIHIDKETLGKRSLVGFNGMEPFVTEDHCFIDPYGSNTRLSFSDKNINYHWKNLSKISENSVLFGLDGELLLQNINYHQSANSKTRVFDLITEDHTYIANSIRVYDDFPEIEKYPQESIIITNILGQVTFEDLQGCTDKNQVKEKANFLFKKYIRKAIEKFIKDSSNNSISGIFQDQVVHYINNLIENQSPLIYLASEIWSLYLVELKSIFQNITNLGSSINAMTHDTSVCFSTTTI
jgi:hypothetical protein